MKKTILTITFSLFVAFLVNAQSLSLSHNGIMLGDTVTVPVDPIANTYVDFEMAIHNHTDNGMNVQVAKRAVNALAENQFLFCVGVACYPPTVDSCGDDVYEFVPAGGASEEKQFKITYNTSSALGIAMVRYNVYNKDNPADSVFIYVKYFAYPDGIAEEAMNGGSISEIYPNPAANSVTLDYQFTNEVRSAQIRVSNLLGSVVKESELQINSNKAKLDISNLENGIYFYSVIVNGDVYKTKKLIVRH